MSNRLDLVKIAREEQDGDLFKLLDSIYKRSTVRPAGYPDAIIWEGGNFAGGKQGGFLSQTIVLGGKNANGKMALLSVDLHPNIAFSGAKLPAQADLDWLHDKAHKECFIANSVLTEVHVVAV